MQSLKSENVQLSPPFCLSEENFLIHNLLIQQKVVLDRFLDGSPSPRHPEVPNVSIWLCSPV